MTAEVVIEREDVARFAEAAADHNPIHLDDEFARAAGQPEAIVHGALTLSRVVEFALARFGPDARVASLEVRFEQPLPVGGRLHMRAEVDKPGDGAVTRLAISGSDEHGGHYVVGELRVAVDR